MGNAASSAQDREVLGVQSLAAALALDRMLRKDPSADRDTVGKLLRQLTTLAEPQLNRDVFNLQGSAETYDLVARSFASSVDPNASDVRQLTRELLSLIKEYDSHNDEKREKAIKDLRAFCLALHRESLESDPPYHDEEPEHVGHAMWP